MRMRTWLIGVILLPFADAAPAHAGAIVSPINVLANTMGTAAGSTGHIIDESGLSGGGFISGSTDYDTYVAGNPTHAGLTGGNSWASATGFAGKSMVFDLGRVATILSFALWNQTTTSAMKNFTLTSAQDSDFTAGVTTLGTFTANANLNVQSFTVSGTGEFVKLQVNSNYIVNNLGNVNIGEVAFDVIPEPAGIAVLGVGLACIGLVRRRTAAVRRDLDNALI
jgi:hypothetical protein